MSTPWLIPTSRIHSGRADAISAAGAERRWRQAECEIAEFEVWTVAVEQFTAEAADIAPAKPPRKKATKAVGPTVVAAAPTFTRKAGAPKLATTAALLN